MPVPPVYQPSPKHLLKWIGNTNAMNQKQLRLFRKEKGRSIRTLVKSTNFIKGLSFREDFLFYKVEKLPHLCLSSTGSTQKSPPLESRLHSAGSRRGALPGPRLWAPMFSPISDPPVNLLAAGELGRRWAFNYCSPHFQFSKVLKLVIFPLWQCILIESIGTSLTTLSFIGITATDNQSWQENA